MKSLKGLVWISVVLVGLAGVAAPAAADIIHADDVIINGGSLCVGVDCVDGEAFGFDTIRLKENNLRIHFDDTSSTASFPANDWRLVINDTTNGGANKFSIEDVTGGRTPFTIEAGAPSNSIFSDSSGRLGIKTSNPVVELHVVDGDTPTLRLEQDGSSGFTPQTWDVAGNEGGFFIRDVTGGSTLPFRILPGAQSQTLVIDGNSEVGIGAGTNPTARLHVKRTDGTAKVLVQESSATAAARTMFELKNDVGNQTIFRLNDGAAGVWDFKVTLSGFIANLVGVGGNEMVVDPSGNMTIAGSLTQLSSRDSKHNFEEVDSQEILSKVVGLPIYEWTYKDDRDFVRHVGPVAEDFHAAFGLNGPNTEGISATDAQGVALLAIQGLDERLHAKDNELAYLDERLGELKLYTAAQEEQLTAVRSENTELRARLEALEAAISALSSVK
jgi:hypothetical protein